MTNKEAIKILDNLKPGDYSNPYEKGEAIVMAISALQAQDSPKPTAESVQNVQNEDLISRKAAIDVIEEMQMPIMRSMFPEEQFVFNGMSEALSAIKDLPSAQPESEERKAESAQNVPKEDLISRKAAIDALRESRLARNPVYMTTAMQVIEKLPPAQPERKKGKWTGDNACPFCGFQPWYERDIHTLSFCPNCGADLQGDDHDL